MYSFQATAGTEVWLDIDRTSHALDTVLELVDEQGLVLARSDNSGEEAENPNLLYRDPTLSEPLVLHPLNKSVFDAQDRWTTNPHDAGMRVVLPGPVGLTNTYQVRVRSSSSQLGTLNAGLTTGVYQLQVRLRELDEVPGSTVRMADIRYAVNGIEVTGGPSHSPLTGEAGEAVDAQGNDTNNDLTTPDNLGNLLNTDRGTLSVAGALANAGDVDWYQFDVRYDAVQTDDPNAPRHVSVAFDVDYADGFARANTNLWVFNCFRSAGVGRRRLGHAGRPAGRLGPFDGRSVARLGGSPGSVHRTCRVAGGVRICSRDVTTWPCRPMHRFRKSCSSSSSPRRSIRWCGWSR